MNLTISALRSAINTNISPMFSGAINYNFQNSAFSRHISTILRTSNRFSFKRTTFSRVLDSAIVLDSGSQSYNRKLFKSTEKVKDTDCSIIQCNFYDCKSSGTGGAIDFNCRGACEFSVVISKTGFSKCQADSCGAFQIKSGKLSLSESCFYCCQGKTNSNFKFSGKECSVEDVYVESSKGSHGIDIDCSGNLKYNGVNHTNNFDNEKSFLILVSNGDFYTKYLSFESNDIWNSIVYFKRDGATPQYINFNHDKSAHPIEVGSSMQLFYCYFINQRCNVYIATNNMNVNLRDSAWSGVESEKAKAFPNVVILKDDLINEAKEIGKMEIKKSSECWLMVPAGGDMSIIGRISPIKWAIIIGSVVLIIAFVFFFVCRKRRYGISTARLAYTL